MKFRFLIIVFLFLGFSAFSQDRDQTLKVAEEHMIAGEFELARQQYELLTDVDVKDGDAWLGKGIAYDKMKDYNEALTCYQSADLYLKDSAIPSYYAGIIHDRYKNYSAAIEAFSYSLEKDTVLPGIYYLIGKSMYHLENSLGSTDYLYKHLKFEPEHGYANYYLSKIYLEANETDSATKYIQKALVSQLIPPRFHLLDGDIHYSTGDWSNAMLSYSAALKLNPKYQNARISRAVCYKKMKAYSLAVSDFELALEEEPSDPYMLYDLGSCQKELERYEDAIKTFNKLDLVDPNSNSAKEAIMDIYFKKGDYSKALEVSKELIKKSPQNDVYHFEKGNAHQFMGETQLAFESYDFSVNINPKNEAAWFNKAVTAYQLDRKEQACHIWRQMITKAVDPFYKEQADLKLIDYCE